MARRECWPGISPWGTVGFIERMNEKASELGLLSTHLTDPAGLRASNVSSAYDLSRLITYASRNAQIAEIMRKGVAPGQDEPPAHHAQEHKQAARWGF